MSWTIWCCVKTTAYKLFGHNVVILWHSDKQGGCIQQQKVWGLMFWEYSFVEHFSVFQWWENSIHYIASFGMLVP